MKCFSAAACPCPTAARRHTYATSSHRRVAKSFWVGRPFCIHRFFSLFDFWWKAFWFCFTTSPKHVARSRSPAYFGHCHQFIFAFVTSSLLILSPVHFRCFRQSTCVLHAFFMRFPQARTHTCHQFTFRSVTSSLFDVSPVHVPTSIVRRVSSSRFPVPLRTWQNSLGIGFRAYACGASIRQMCKHVHVALSHTLVCFGACACVCMCLRV